MTLRIAHWLQQLDPLECSCGLLTVHDLRRNTCDIYYCAAQTPFIVPLSVWWQNQVKWHEEPKLTGLDCVHAKLHAQWTTMHFHAIALAIWARVCLIYSMQVYGIFLSKNISLVNQHSNIQRFVYQPMSHTNKRCPYRRTTLSIRYNVIIASWFQHKTVNIWI